MKQQGKKQKSLFDLWANIRVSHLNRLLRPFDVRLVEKKSKAWGEKVVITAEKIPAPVAAPVDDGTVGADPRLNQQ